MSVLTNASVISTTNLVCGCTKESRELSIYGGTHKPFYTVNTSNCNHQHGVDIYSGTQCGCYIKFNYNEKTIKIVVFQCPNIQCNVKQLLAEDYTPLFLEYLKNSNLDMDELNVHMYNFINQ